MKVLWEVSAAECLCSGQYEKVGFPLLPWKLKTAVKFHYYTYHECFTHFAFVHLLFFQVGKSNWFYCGQLVFLWSIFRVGGGVYLEGENQTQIKINYPPHILQLCGQVCLIKNTCWKSSKFFVFNCIEYGTSLLRERLPYFETSTQTRVYACKR